MSGAAQGGSAINTTYNGGVRTYSEREMVLAERRAFENGMVRMHGEMSRTLMPPPFTLQQIEGMALAAFPFPKVKRPRVVADTTGVRWRVTHTIGGALIEYSEMFTPTVWHDAMCARAGTPGMNVERIRLLADLVANPTEEVDDGASS